MQTQTLRERTRKGSGIQLPTDISQPLQEFGREIGMSGAQLARTGLRYMLEKFKNGEVVILNGQVVPNPGRPKAA